jgi:hypothetical protein
VQYPLTWIRTSEWLEALAIALACRDEVLGEDGECGMALLVHQVIKRSAVERFAHRALIRITFLAHRLDEQPNGIFILLLH